MIYLPTCWLIFMVNVGKYTIHGSYGKHIPYIFGSLGTITQNLSIEESSPEMASRQGAILCFRSDAYSRKHGDK